MKIALAFVAFMMAAPAFANDGGISAIKVSEIKMREYNDMGKEVKRLASPNFKISFKGGEAAKLQQILPSELSVITSMQPELTKEFNATFKSLGIYANDSKGVKGKAITISCSNGQLKSSPGDDSKMIIEKNKDTECTISINPAEGDSAMDQFGDMQKFAPKCSN